MTGEKHLGAVNGTGDFRDAYVEKAVKSWEMEIELVTAKTEMQAAYTTFNCGIKQIWKYLVRTVPDITPLLKPLKDTLRNTFMPAIASGRCTKDQERRLLQLPPRISNDCTWKEEGP